MKSVFIAADVERLLTDALRSDANFTIVNTLADAEVLITRAFIKVDRAMIDAAPKLEVLAQGTSGIDNIDLDAVRDRGVTLIHLPGVNANSVVELVIGNMIALTRTIPFYTGQVADGVFDRTDCMTRHELSYFTLGIIGLGNVGSRLAKLASAFGMRVVAYDPYITDFGIAKRADSLIELIAASEIITLHVPLTDETRKMIAARELAMMKRGTIVINASRGEVLDTEAALASLVDHNHLGGLALDVFDPEPPRHPLPHDPRLILTPHIAGCTAESKTAAGVKLYEKLVEFYQTR